MSQKGFSTTIFVVISLIVLAGAGGYFFLKPEDVPISRTGQEEQVTTKLDIGTITLPVNVEGLCSNSGEQEFATSEEQRHTFYESASSIKRCGDGTIWAVSEDGAKVNDAATFYFNENGILLDICQPLFWRSGCEKFGSFSCEEKNYCTENRF